MKALKYIVILPLVLAILLAGLIVVIIETREPSLKPINEEWVLFVTEIEGKKIQIRVMEEDYEDFRTFLRYIGVPKDMIGRR